MARVLQILFFALVVSGCDRNDLSSSGASIASEDVTRVVAFRFVLPGEDAPDTPMPSGFSLIDQSGKLDLTLLSELKVKEADLTIDQRDRLVAAVYGEHPVTSAAACYDPHHIFVFYDENGQIINLVEICFGCLNVHTYPELEETQWRRHDFRSLARLCDEIGIGMTSRTAEDLIRFWDESDRLGSKPNGG